MVIAILALTFFLWPRTEGIASTLTDLQQTEMAELAESSFLLDNENYQLKNEIWDEEVQAATPVESISLSTPQIIPMQSTEDLMPLALSAEPLDREPEVAELLLGSSHIMKEDWVQDEWIQEELVQEERSSISSIQEQNSQPREAAVAQITVAVPELDILPSAILTQQRILASLDWLNSADRTSYTIQFMSGLTSDI